MGEAIYRNYDAEALYAQYNNRAMTPPEELAAIIETRETDAAKHKEIERAARKKVLTTTGIPLRHVLIVPAGGVEKTTSGKLARRATRARYADRLPRSDS